MFALILLSLVSVTLGVSQELDLPTLFSSPIINDGNDYYTAGVHLDEVTYVYFNSSYNGKNWFPEPAINATNALLWSDNTDYRDAYITIIRGHGRIYFSTKYSITGKRVIGVTFNDYIRANNVWGNLNEPLVSDPKLDLGEPSVTPNVDSRTAYFIFYTGLQDGRIHSSEISFDGLEYRRYLSFFAPTLDWEGEKLSKPHAIRKDGYYYIFYTANDPCSENAAVGVIRSEKIAGTFEKMSTPLVSAKNFKNKSTLCNAHPQAVVESLVRWGEDGWPYVL